MPVHHGICVTFAQRTSVDTYNLAVHHGIALFIEIGLMMCAPATCSGFVAKECATFALYGVHPESDDCLWL